MREQFSFCVFFLFFSFSFFFITRILKHWHGWCHMKPLPSRRVLCAPYNHAPCLFMQSYIRKVRAFLAVTCHLHIWQHGWGLLRATAVTRGWKGYRNMSQRRKLTLEKKILPPLLQGFEPETFKSQVRRWLTTELSSLPCTSVYEFIRNLCRFIRSVSRSGLAVRR